MSARVLPHIVVVGGGFGGMNVVRGLRRAKARVTLVDRNNHHLFQPLLYQVATAGLSPADIAFPIRAVFRHQANVEVLMAEVVGVDSKSRKVFLKGDHPPLGYDILVLATGSSHSYFGKDEWAEFAPGLKTIEDATAIRRKILLSFEAAEMEPDAAKRAALLTFVIVGGGPTGVELAGSIAELSHQALKKDFRNIDPASTRILLVEAGGRVLAAFDERLSQKAREELNRLGVEVQTGMRVEEVDAEGVAVSGKRIAARTVIWAAGVVASPAARWLGVESDRVGRVKVNPDLTVPGSEDVFVIGDTALLAESGHVLPGVAPVAMQQGRYVARAILSRLGGGKATGPFHYWNKGSLATVGRSFAVAEMKRLKLSGFPAWLAWVGVHIYYLIGFRNRALVLLEWAWAYLTFQRGARLITRV